MDLVKLRAEIRDNEKINKVNKANKYKSIDIKKDAIYEGN